MPLSLRALRVISAAVFAPVFASAADTCDDSCQLNRAFAKLVRGEKNGLREELQKIADRGYLPAQITLAEFYIISEGDLAKGRAILEPLANGGNAKAQLHLAQSYLGRGSSELDVIGVTWLRAAADSGEPTAIEMLALALRKGSWGVDPNSSEAIRYESMLPKRAP